MPAPVGRAERGVMIKLGEKQILEVVKKVEFGVYLAPNQEEKDDKVLLPAKQVPEGTQVGDQLEVFLYRDSKDRLIATTNTPKLMMGQVALLKVAQTGKIGAFLDWGLEKDLMLPFRQQTKPVKEGEEVLVSLYIDKSSRLCATMNVYRDLQNDSPYQKEDRVVGRVYQISEQFGAFVAVDNRYSALIPQKELYGGGVEVGQDVQARVVKVLPDGRLTLGIREKAYIQMNKDAEELLRILGEYDGVLPFNDRVSPEIIKRETGMSKNEFKRAVGKLLKEGKIELSGKGIRAI